MGKGLTPLASTLILVAVSIALGAAVMTWGEEFIEQRATFAQEPADCSATGITPVTIQSIPAVCYSDDGISALLDNTGTIALDQVFAQIIGTDIYTTTAFADLPVHGAGKVTLTYDAATQGIPRQLRLTPHLDQACTSHTITIEPIPPCQ